MKLIIDFPDELKDEFNQKGLTDQLFIKAKEKNGLTVLLDNVTNGDTIKAICPSWIDYHDTDVELIINNKEWNAPYNGGRA